MYLMPVTGGQYAVTASAVSIATALSLAADAGKSMCKQIIIQYNEDGTADAFMGSSGVTTAPANVYHKFQLVAANLPPRILVLGDAGGSRDIDLRDLFLIGTANAANLFFITIVY
jgi:hypothetical protein